MEVRVRLVDGAVGMLVGEVPYLRPDVVEEDAPVFEDSPLRFQLSEEAPQRLRQFIQQFGVLHQIIEGAQLHHLHCESLVSLSGHDDKRRRRAALFQQRDQLLSGHVG